MRFKAFTTLQAAICIPIIFMFVILCYEYTIRLHTKMAVETTFNELNDDLKLILQNCTTDDIHSMKIIEHTSTRNIKSILQKWHFGIDNSKVSKLLQNTVTERLSNHPLKDLKMNFKWKKGFLNNGYTVSLKASIVSIFKVEDLYLQKEFSLDSKEESQNIFSLMHTTSWIKEKIRENSDTLKNMLNFENKLKYFIFKQ